MTVLQGHGDPMERQHAMYMRETGEPQDVGGGQTAPAPVNGHNGQDAGVVMVDELAGPDDYWLTLTDAARITRRQEVTIRRWVAAGHLPVRRQPMGLTKRTRHVRASDLSRLSPIIDPSAAISDATAHLDLVGIPQQQAQLQAAQHRLTSDIARLIQLASDLAADMQTVREQMRASTVLHGVLEQLTGELGERSTTIETRLTEQRTDLDTGLAALDGQCRALAEEGRILARIVTQVEETLSEYQQWAAAAEREQQRLAGEVEALRGQLAVREAQQRTYIERLVTLEGTLAALEQQQRMYDQQIAELSAAAARTDDWQVHWQQRHDSAITQLETFLATQVARQERLEEQLSTQRLRLAELERREEQLRRRLAGGLRSQRNRSQPLRQRIVPNE